MVSTVTEARTGRKDEWTDGKKKIRGAFIKIKKLFPGVIAWRLRPSENSN